MATLIPALGSCAARMTSGEKRLAERLEQKLDDDYLLWYDVPVGPKQTHPDFVIIHPRRGLLILETKDWRLDTIQQGHQAVLGRLHPTATTKVVINPLAQARHCAIQVVNALERDPQLVQPDGPHQGKLAFPWGHGVVFTRITRKQFDSAGLGEAIEPHYVICQDEMTEAVDAEAFQQRLWDMFPHAFGKVMSLPQLDRVRWIMFPEVRVPHAGRLFGRRRRRRPARHHARDGPAAGAAGPQPGRGPPRDPRRGRLGQDHDPGLPRRIPGEAPSATKPDPRALLQRAAGREAGSDDGRARA